MLEQKNCGGRRQQSRVITKLGSFTIILRHCRVVVHYCKCQVGEDDLPLKFLVENKISCNLSISYVKRQKTTGKFGGVEVLRLLFITAVGTCDPNVF